jgi:DNA-binding GntR family transcriptional regulator
MQRCHDALVKASHSGDVDAYVRANLDWHVAVVRASHNDLLIAFIAAVSQSVYESTDLEGFNSNEVRSAVIHAHQRVMDAIRERDADAAARRMERHVGAYIDDVRKSDAPGPTRARRSNPKASSS